MDGLFKKTELLAQIGLSKKDRELNLGGSFETGRKFHGMKMLLVDDVMTTGSTAKTNAQKCFCVPVRKRYWSLPWAGRIIFSIFMYRIS